MGNEGDLFWVAYPAGCSEGCDVGLVLHQINAFAGLPHGAFDFGVAFVADHDDFCAELPQFCDHNVDFGHQWAGGVEYAKFALCCFGLQCF